MQTQNVCNELFVELRKINRAMDIHSKKLVQRVGLTAPQMVILKEIIQLERVTVSVLARNASLSLATVTTILDRLEKYGHVTRVRDVTDKRLVYVQATDKAKQVIQTAPTLLQEHFIEKFEKLEGWEQSLLLSSLQRIAYMMNAQKIEIVE